MWIPRPAFGSPSYQLIVMPHFYVARRRFIPIGLTGLLAVLVIVAAVVGIRRSPSSPSEALDDPSAAGLQAAAAAYATAWLTGSSDDLIAILDPACTKEVNAGSTFVYVMLRRFRLLVKQHTGVTASDIKVGSVNIRNFRFGRSGGAEVQYDLPASIAGNDNWNTYGFSGGQWHYEGCALGPPIGGFSESSSLRRRDVWRCPHCEIR